MPHVLYECTQVLDLMSEVGKLYEEYFLQIVVTCEILSYIGIRKIVAKELCI